MTTPLKPGEIHHLSSIPKFEPINQGKLENLEQAIELAKLLPDSHPERIRLLETAARVWVFHNTIVALSIAEEETPKD